jgi:hypothetical protein
MTTHGLIGMNFMDSQENPSRQATGLTSMGTQATRPPNSTPERKNDQRNPKLFITLLLPFASIFLFVGAGEIALRFYHLWWFDISIIDGQPRHQSSRSFSPITLDDQLGWRTTENYRFEGTKHSSDGIQYPARVSQDENGFRMSGNVSSNKPKIFVIGDSFTQAVDASDDKTYYAIVKQLLDVEIFAYGAGGYGSLQEFLIFDKYFDLVKPDIVLWQYSMNDIINNSPELEAASRINNNGMVRPYLWNDQIQYILPKNSQRRSGYFLSNIADPVT